MTKKTAAISVIVLLTIGFIVGATPKKAEALQLFSPFGGKVLAWLPEAPGCAPITAAISILTLGSVNITIEELKVGPPKAATLGLLRVDGLTIPGLTTIYRNSTYFTPGVNVVGTSIDVCNVCDKVGDIPFIGSICDIPVVSDILDATCDIAAGACPFGNLIHTVGSSLAPSL